MIPQERIEAPELDYRYRFRPEEHGEIESCLEAHGFAVVERMIAPELVERLRQSVRRVIDPEGSMARGDARTQHSFMEYDPTSLELLDHPDWLDLIVSLYGTDQLRFHRSAGIVRMPSAEPVRWHSDWSFWSGLYQKPPRNVNDVLNTHEGLGGRWFYLEGTHPMRAGLAVIEDSHRIDWPGPEGFEFTDDRRSFFKKGTAPAMYDRWDVPGIVPLFTDPGDMILFASRTYHYAFPHRGDQPRHSCGGPGLVPKAWDTFSPWPLPERTRRFIDQLPERFKPYAEGYGGFDEHWSFDAAQLEQSHAM